MKQSRVTHLESEAPMGTILERHSRGVTRNVAKEGMFRLRKMIATTRAWLSSHAVLWGSGRSTETKIERKNLPPPKVFEKSLCRPLWWKGGGGGGGSYGVWQFGMASLVWLLDKKTVLSDSAAFVSTEFPYPCFSRSDIFTNSPPPVSVFLETDGRVWACMG